jgi:hypothetical protein
MNSWEYRRMVTDIGHLIKGEADREIERLGAEGWEMVVAVPRERHGYGHEVCLLFKRPRAAS